MTNSRIYGTAEKFSFAQPTELKMYYATITDWTELGDTALDKPFTPVTDLTCEYPKPDHGVNGNGNSVLIKVAFAIIQAYVYAVRYWIQYVAVPFAHYYNRTHLASDGRISNEGVSIQRNVVYGEIPGESMDILSPSESDEFILYVHGGGFVSVHCGVMNHSVTPFVRAGFTVFSMDYPLAPEFKFPVPVVSVIKCLGYVKAHFGVSRVKVVADSAGGCIASLAVGAITNPRKDWGPMISGALRSTDLPVIDGIVLLYTICDQFSWTDTVDLTLSGRMQTALMQFCIAQYRSSPNDKLSIHDNVEKLDLFPATLLVCGNTDPLQHSHAVFHEALVARGVESRHVVVDGFHGFHGLPPPFSFGHWRSTVFPANCIIIRWLRNGCEKRVPELPRISWREYDIHLVIVLLSLHVGLLYGVVTFLINHTL